MSEPGADPISWSIGPANSRLLRVLLYLLVALGGGWAILPLTLMSLAVFVGTLAAPDFLWLALLWFIPMLLLVAAARALARRDSRWTGDGLTRDFLAVTHPTVLVVVAVIGSLGIILIFEIEPSWTILVFEAHEVLLTLWAGLAFVLFIVTVGFGTQSGHLDPADRTLRLSHGIGETVLDLEYLTDVSSFSVGRQTVFRVRVTREGGPFRTHYLVMPAEVADRAAEIFDACLRTPAEREPPDPTTATIAKWSALVGGGITVGLAALLVWADVPLPVVVTVLVLFGAVSMAIWIGVNEY